MSPKKVFILNNSIAVMHFFFLSTESVIIDITNFGDLLNTYHAAVKVYNLKPGKHYFFSFISITKSGERSSPSREVPVNTLPSVPNVSWFRKDNGMLRVNWNNTDHADETDYTIIVAKVSERELIVGALIE